MPRILHVPGSGLDHMKIHKKSQTKQEVNTPVKKLRLIRVAAKRANELLAIITASENDIEENAFCEWVDLTLIDTDNIEIPVNNNNNSQMPI